MPANIAPTILGVGTRRICVLVVLLWLKYSKRAFLDYLDKARMETELIIEAHLPASSEDEANAV